MSRYRGGLDFAMAHVDSCVADVLGARVVGGPRMALRIRFLGRRLEGTKERRKMGHREKGEEKERRKGGRDFRRLTHMRWKCHNSIHILLLLTMS